MRIFAREWVGTLLQRLGMEEGVPIESGMITNRIAAAQKAVETQNFESRKHVLEYDDVMNKQREAVYGLRHGLLEGIDQKELILEDYTTTALSNILDETAPEKAHADQWKIDEMKTKLIDIFGTDFPNIDFTALNRHELGEALFGGLQQRYELKEQILSPDTLRYHERVVLLSVLDGLWKDHLLAMDHLKEGIGLRGYAQQDPLVAYKKESFDMFEAMMQRFQEDTLRNIFRMQILGPDGVPIDSMEQLAALQAAAALPVAPPPPQLPQTPARTMLSGGGEQEERPTQQEPAFPQSQGPQRQQYAPQKANSGQKPKRRR
jgi:preprotein translocase subunit SecA